MSTSDCVAWGDVGRKRMAWEGRREEKREKRIGTEKSRRKEIWKQKKGIIRRGRKQGKAKSRHIKPTLGKTSQEKAHEVVAKEGASVGAALAPRVGRKRGECETEAALKGN